VRFNANGEPKRVLRGGTSRGIVEVASACRCQSRPSSPMSTPVPLPPAQTSLPARSQAEQQGAEKRPGAFGIVQLTTIASGSPAIIT
jgi:hypothetical protein